MHKVLLENGVFKEASCYATSWLDMGYCLLQQLGISIHLGRGLSGVYPGSIIHYCGIKRAFCNLLWDLLIYNSKEKCRHNMRFIGRTCY